jgi:hypothetical protein
MLVVGYPGTIIKQSILKVLCTAVCVITLAIGGKNWKVIIYLLPSQSRGKLSIDYTSKKLHIIDREIGEIKPVEDFVATLATNQYTPVKVYFYK